MREIKFRGKNVYTDVWVYGNLITTAPEVAPTIVTTGSSSVGYSQIEHTVDIDTVGQYTEQNDNSQDNIEIFEGDIVARTVLAFGDQRTFIGEVKMYEGCWWIDNGTAAIPLWNEFHELKVLGNIYENPELLEESI
ncbi:gp52 [Niallia circulans]|uniref:YopX family protein n=1 Tax=Niallia circulans TaxID=1397 RepID=UPI00077CC220|nr:YopX family protein [Niallia circulans]MDR4315034.1 hypothetical protein [Niallia circulans]MED3839765.1 YopX family protein [Niallia circulans]MED4241251.1 YopX family protein [Niallia circulans]MED4247912.1 YopX family protein [Niallia circulans]QKH61609.1 hypothetical protein FOC77_13605 [Niallia circulans]